MTSLHLTAEDLSAYLDEALPPAAVERVERHLADCASCRRHLGGLRLVTGGLRRLERQAPPATLGQMVARRVAFERSRPSLGLRLEQGFQLLERQSPLLMLFALVIAFAVMILFFAQALEERRRAGSPVIFQDPPASTAESGEGATTRNLAGRQFLLTDAEWIEVGINRAVPHRSIDLESAPGKALLEAHPELAELAELGAPVRLGLDGEVIRLVP